MDYPLQMKIMGLSATVARMKPNALVMGYADGLRWMYFRLRDAEGDLGN